MANWASKAPIAVHDNTINIVVDINIITKKMLLKSVTVAKSKAADAKKSSTVELDKRKSTE